MLMDTQSVSLMASSMAASWLYPPVGLCVCQDFTHVSVHFPHYIYAIALVCHVRVCVCASLCVCACVFPPLCAPSPHPGGLASVLYRRRSSIPQRHLAPLPKCTPPFQACITTTITTTAPHQPSTMMHPHDPPKTNPLSHSSFFSYILHWPPPPPPTATLVNCFINHYLMYPVDSARSVSGVVMLLMRTRFPLLPGSLI